MMNTIGDKYTVKRKKGQYVMSFEMNNSANGNLSQYDLYFNKDLFLIDMKIYDNGQLIRQTFSNGKKTEYPEFIKNYESGERVTVTVVNIHASKTESFPLKKGVKFALSYSGTKNPFDLYLDEECTVIYCENGLSDTVNEDITVYLQERVPE